MGQIKFFRDNNAVANIDFIFAIVLFLGSIATAILIMPNLSHEDRDWRIKQYMAATRATDSLIQDPGELGWEENWTSGNYQNVIRVGFLYNNDAKVLNSTKIHILMGQEYIDDVTNIPWWEFPGPTTSKEEYHNVTRILGLGEYNLYMQLHPVGVELFNSTPLDTNISNRSIINLDTVSIIDRYVYIVNPSSSDKIKYITHDNEAIHYRLNLWIW